MSRSGALEHCATPYRLRDRSYSSGCHIVHSHLTESKNHDSTAIEKFLIRVTSRNFFSLWEVISQGKMKTRYNSLVDLNEYPAIIKMDDGCIDNELSISSYIGAWWPLIKVNISDIDIFTLTRRSADIKVAWNQIRSRQDTVSRFREHHRRAYVFFVWYPLREIRIGVVRVVSWGSHKVPSFGIPRRGEPAVLEPLLSVYALVVGPRHSWIESTADRSAREPRRLFLRRGVRLHSSIHEYAWWEVGAREKIYGPDSLTFRGPRTAFARAITRWAEPNDSRE